MKDIQYSKQAAKKLARMPKNTARRILDTVEAYAGGDTDGLDVKVLKGSIYSRIRVADWRIIIDDKGTVLFVIKVAARGDVYK
ncbi:MAG: type II toxin-antitoxin system RelE/ParE family toxin [Gammaproteobacteria bacterium]|nr:type II toxin-antitoxin system RelE/ParE family toxin [Gammaproteobacteria bacterium]